jgi:hypothetical protein
MSFVYVDLASLSLQLDMSEMSYSLVFEPDGLLSNSRTPYPLPHRWLKATYMTNIVQAVLTFNWSSRYHEF